MLTMMPIFRSYKDRANGSANVYEASSRRLVIVSNEGDQAQELTRR